MRILLAFLFTVLSISPAYAQTTVGAILDGTEMTGQKSQTNYAVNPGFEKKGTIGVTSGGTGSHIVFQRSQKGVASYKPIKGNGSLSFSSATVGHTFTFDSNDLDPIMYGKQCVVRQYYRGGGTGVSGYKVYMTINGVKVAQSETTATIEDVLVPKLFNYSYPCGNSTSGKIRIVWETTLTSVVTMDVDETYIGLDDNIGTVAQASFFGGIDQPGASGCSYLESTSSGPGNFVDLQAGSGCGAWSSVGSVTPIGTNDHRAVATGMAAGVYNVKITGSAYLGTAGACYFKLSDGTNTYQSQTIYISSAAGVVSPVLEFTVPLETSAASKTYKIVAADSHSSACGLVNDTAGGTNLSWKFYYFPTQAQTAVRMDNSNLDTRAYAPALPSGAFGAASTVEFFYSRSGDKADVKGSFITGTVGGSPGVIPMPGTVNAALMGTTPKIVGRWVRGNNVNGANKAGVMVWFPGSPGTVEMANDDKGAPLYPTGSVGANNFVTSNEFVTVYITGVPIVGWSGNQNAPLLVGGVTSSSTGLEIMNRARVTNSNAGQTVDKKSGNWLTAGGCSGAGQCTWTIAAGVYSDNPSCTCSAGLGNANGCAVSVNSNISVVIFTKNFSTYVNEAGVSLLCMGPR